MLCFVCVQCKVEYLIFFTNIWIFSFSLSSFPKLFLFMILNVSMIKLGWVRFFFSFILYLLSTRLKFWKKGNEEVRISNKGDVQFKKHQHCTFTLFPHMAKNFLKGYDRLAVCYNLSTPFLKDYRLNFYVFPRSGIVTLWCDKFDRGIYPFIH